jgi:hypothetical protein
MMSFSSCHNAEFDEYAETYDSALARGLSVSGEDKKYFARGRIEWLRDCLQRLQEQPKTLMDFGCGTGSATPFSSFRPVEPLVSRLPLGAQYQVLCRKPI